MNERARQFPRPTAGKRGRPKSPRAKTLTVDYIGGVLRYDGKCVPLAELKLYRRGRLGWLLGLFRRDGYSITEIKDDG